MRRVLLQNALVSDLRLVPLTQAQRKRQISTLPRSQSLCEQPCGAPVPAFRRRSQRTWVIHRMVCCRPMLFMKPCKSINNAPECQGSRWNCRICHMPAAHLSVGSLVPCPDGYRSRDPGSGTKPGLRMRTLHASSFPGMATNELTRATAVELQTNHPPLRRCQKGL